MQINSAAGIVKRYPDITPNERQIVYATNGRTCDKCMFIDGKFIGGGEMYVKEYELPGVTKWFDFEAYCKWHTDRLPNGIGSYDVTFEAARKITEA